MKYLGMILVGLIVVYLWLTFPRLSRKKQFEPLEKYFYAHRGLHNDVYPENSLPAFENAKKHGYGIELDVQLTKDGTCVIMHDFHLKRACDVDRQIDSCTYDEIKDLKLFDSEYKIPLFTEVLDLIHGKVPLIIEIKQKGVNCTTCEKVWEILKDYKGMYVVESFNPMAMNWFLKNHPEIIRGQLSTRYKENKTMNPALKFALSHLLTNFLSRPDFIAYDVDDYKAEFSNQFLYKFWKVKTVLWTIKNREMFDICKHESDCQIFEKFLAD